MSTIKIHTESPTTAINADGVTPKTAAPASTLTTQRGPAVNPATTTAVPSTSTYRAAQPGAAAMPLPTSASQRYVPVALVPLSPTPTRKLNGGGGGGGSCDGPNDDGPHAPQPGAFPIPSNGMRSNLPPPPKAGEKYQAPAPQSRIPQPSPWQMSMAPPTLPVGGQPPRSSTGTFTTSSVAYHVSLPSDNFGAPQQSLEHPPGYSQNTSHLDSPPGTGRNEFNPSSHAGGSGEDEDSLWNTTKSWVETVGKKVSEAEAEVWRRVHGGK